MGLWQSGDTQWQGNVTIRQSPWETGIGEGAAMPRTVDFAFEGLHGAPSFEATVEVREGVPELVRWCFTAPEGTRGLRSADFRSVDVGLFIENVAAAVGVRYEAAGAAWEVLNDEESAERAHRAARRAPRRRGGPPLAEVAKAYREGLPGGKPTQVVAARFGVAHRTAALYVQKARQAGELGPSSVGRAGEN